MLQLITTQEELQSTINDAILQAYKKLSLTNPQQDEVEIIDGKELIKRLNISEPTLIRWRKKSKIPFLQLGTSLRYDWRKVLNSLEHKNGGSRK
jgi:hypothetical protein